MKLSQEEGWSPAGTKDTWLVSESEMPTQLFHFTRGMMEGENVGGGWEQEQSRLKEETSGEHVRTPCRGILGCATPRTEASLSLSRALQ